MTNRRLFGSDPKPRKTKTVDPYPGAGQRLVGIYIVLYEQRYGGERPVIEPRAAAQFKKLLNEQGPEKTEARLRFFMQWNEPFVVTAGHALSVFPSQWNKMTALLQKQIVVASVPACRHVPKCKTESAHSLKMIAEMKAATDHQTMAPRPSPSASSPTTSKRNEVC